MTAASTRRFRKTAGAAPEGRKSAASEASRAETSRGEPERDAAKQK
jgi:hypothetical protein